MSPPAVTWKVEAAFGTDPLSTTDSDFTADLSDRLRSFSSSRGKTAEFQDNDAGTSIIRFTNNDGELTPANTSGTWFGQLLPNRLIRISAEWNAVEYWQFTGLIEAFEQEVEAGSPDHVCALRVVDGMKILNLERSPTFPDYAEEVERVLDPVWGYWRMNEPPTTRVKPGGWVKKKDNKDRDKKPQRRWRKKRTQRFLAGASGPEAQVIGQPAFLQSSGEGPIAGEFTYGMRLDGTQRLKVPVPEADDRPGAENAITVSFMVYLPAVTSGGFLVCGPTRTTSGLPAWDVKTTGGDEISFFVTYTDENTMTLNTGSAGGTPNQLTAGEWHHVVCTFRGDTGVGRIFIDGNQCQTATLNDNGNSGIGQLARGDTAAPIYIGYEPNEAIPIVNYSIAEVVVSEAKANEVFAANVMQMYQASVAGFGSPANLPTSGERIEAVLDGITDVLDASYFTSARRDIDPGEQAVRPQRVDESKIEMIRNAEETEGGMLFVATDGTLTFRDNTWFESGAGADVKLTLESDGTGITFQAIAPALSDDMLFPVVTVTREDGNPQTVGDTSEFFGAALELADTLHTTDAAAADRATRDQERFGQARNRIYRIDLDTLSNDLLYPHVFGRELGDRVVVNHTYDDGTMETFDCRIIGISRESSGGYVNTASWSLAPSYFPTAATWRLGVTGFSELSDTTILA